MKRLLILAVAAASALSAACGSKFSKKGGPSPAAANNQGLPPYRSNPPPVAPAAQNYPHQQLDPYSALNGSGQWVVIDGERFFVPDLNQVQDGAAWEPYQEGRWTYDNQRGWTWASNDPWGWMTDHYGVWRHHRRHGWVWLPFHDMRYEPHCVTWFDEGDHIGWYPYHSEYARAYRFTDRHGFDDGYWLGHRAVLSLNGNGFGYHLGFTVVHREHATHDRIRVRAVRDRRLIINALYRSHSGERLRRVGRHPGGDRGLAFDFVQRYSRERAPVGDAIEVRSRGGARFLQPFNGRNPDGRGRRRERGENTQRDRWQPERKQGTVRDQRRRERDQARGDKRDGDERRRNPLRGGNPAPGQSASVDGSRVRAG